MATAAYDALAWSCNQVPAGARNPPTRKRVRGEELHGERTSLRGQPLPSIHRKVGRCSYEGGKHSTSPLAAGRPQRASRVSIRTESSNTPARPRSEHSSDIVEAETSPAGVCPRRRLEPSPLSVPVVEVGRAAQHVVLPAGPNSDLVAVGVLGDPERVLR